MNFEQLCKTVAYNIPRLKNKNKTKLFIKHQYEVLRIKKNKLKLAAIVFEIIETIFADIVVHEDVDIRYICQDNTESDEMKFENRLKALDWKWNIINVLSLLIVFFFTFLLICAAVYMWYCNNLPDFAYQDPKYNTLVEKSLKMIMTPSGFIGIRLIFLLNLTLVDYMIAVCSFFNVLF